jgi:hypothetical protein
MNKKYKLLIVSFLALNFYGWILAVEVKYGIPEIVKYVLSVSVLCIMIWYKFKNPIKPLPGGFLNIVIVVFVVWSLILVVASVLRANSIFFIQMALAMPYYLIPYLLPVLLLYSKFDLNFFSNLFFYSFILIIPSLIIQLLIIATGLSQENWSEQANLIRIFDIASFLLLFTGHLARKKYIFNLALIYNLIWFLLWAYYGRRGMMADNLLLIIMMVVIRLKSLSLNRSDRFRMYFLGLIAFLLLLSFGYLFSSTYAFQRGFDSSALEESRGSVFETFFYDFGTLNDWVFGRGLDGTVLRSFNTNNMYSSVENGFLTILLKGGLLFSIPFLLILFRAIYLGFFRTKNDLTKALSAYIFVFFIIMGYFNLPDYSTHYILLWISVSACFTPALRNHSNEEVYLAINSHFK